MRIRRIFSSAIASSILFSASPVNADQNFFLNLAEDGGGYAEDTWEIFKTTIDGSTTSLELLTTVTNST